MTKTFVGGLMLLLASSANATLVTVSHEFGGLADPVLFTYEDSTPDQNLDGTIGYYYDAMKLLDLNYGGVVYSLASGGTNFIQTRGGPGQGTGPANLFGEFDMVGSDGSVAFAWLRLEAHFASASDSLAELPLLHGYDDSSWIELYFNLDHADISQPHQQFIANSAGFTLVPDPGSLGLMGIGLLAASLARRRRH